MDYYFKSSNIVILIFRIKLVFVFLLGAESSNLGLKSAINSYEN